MSIQLILGIVINIITFGISDFLRKRFFNTIMIIYYLNFVIIILSPERLWIKIVILLLIHSLISPIIWRLINIIVNNKKSN